MNQMENLAEYNRKRSLGTHKSNLREKSPHHFHYRCVLYIPTLRVSAMSCLAAYQERTFANAMVPALIFPMAF